MSSPGAGPRTPDTGHAAGWIVVVPVKHGSHAKSRLASYVGEHRPELARAMALDTVAAALACAKVSKVIAVTSDLETGPLLHALGALVIPDAPEAGLNPALAYGAEGAREHDQTTPVAALSADLPALRPVELAYALTEATRHTLSFLPDTTGSGTTLYCANAGAIFAPRFGARSCEAHRAAGAVELVGDTIPTVRRDVDTPADLTEALRLGVGLYTRGVLNTRGILGRWATLSGMQATIRSFHPDIGSGTVLLDDGVELPFSGSALPPSGLRHLRIGQRVQVQVSGTGSFQRVVALRIYTVP